MKYFSALALVSVLFLPACQTTDDSMASPGETMAVNATCPISGKPVNMDHTLMWEGQVVAFCCGQCPAKWEQMSAMEKEQALADSGM